MTKARSVTCPHCGHVRENVRAAPAMKLRCPGCNELYRAPAIAADDVPEGKPVETPAPTPAAGPELVRARATKAAPPAPLELEDEHDEPDELEPPAPVVKTAQERSQQVGRRGGQSTARRRGASGAYRDRFRRSA